MTLQPRSERTPDPRPALPTKFEGREDGSRYVVTGKGGLIREVQLPSHLAARLEAQRLATPRPVTDRHVYYQQHYAIGGGQPWSMAVSRAAKAALGWSTGAHGLRHAYAQERVTELQTLEHSQKVANETVSQELGHFRPEITTTYLR